MRSKIHRATVTDANLNYEGSITLGENLMRAADITDCEKVLVVNINNGARFETYVIQGEYDGEVCLNGAAARLAEIGDKVIIMAWSLVDGRTDARTHTVYVDDDNAIVLTTSRLV